MNFIETTHLSDILEASEKQTAIIFKYSNTCYSSPIVMQNFVDIIQSKRLISPVFLVTVQTQKALSKSVEEYLSVKHESPQVIVLKNKKVVFTANHNHIKVEDLLQYQL